MLHLPDPHREEIYAHAREAYPHECCGFMIGTKGTPRQVRRVHRLVNQRTDRAHDRYEIDPLDWIRVDKALQGDEQVIGIYHSHPDHPSKPSEFDREHAHPYMSYLIVAVHGGQIESARSWELIEEVFDEEEVHA
jgi:proteasome lid subunit RPN8/RPN11